MKKALPYAYIYILILPVLFAFSETQNSLLQGLRTGNAKEIAGLFTSSVSITIKNETGYYSKFQAEMVLNDFFRANKPVEVKQIQRISNNASNYYIIYSFKTSSDTYRIFVKFVEEAGSHQIAEFRIE